MNAFHLGNTEVVEDLRGNGTKHLNWDLDYEGTSFQDWSGNY